MELANEMDSEVGNDLDISSELVNKLEGSDSELGNLEGSESGLGKNLDLENDTDQAHEISLDDLDNKISIANEVKPSEDEFLSQLKFYDGPSTFDDEYSKFNDRKLPADFKGFEHDGKKIKHKGMDFKHSAKKTSVNKLNDRKSVNKLTKQRNDKVVGSVIKSRSPVDSDDKITSKISSKKRKFDCLDGTVGNVNVKARSKRKNDDIKSENGKKNNDYLKTWNSLDNKDIVRAKVDSPIPVTEAKKTKLSHSSAKTGHNSLFCSGQNVNSPSLSSSGLKSTNSSPITSTDIDSADTLNTSIHTSAYLADINEDDSDLSIKDKTKSEHKKTLKSEHKNIVKYETNGMEKTREGESPKHKYAKTSSNNLLKNMSTNSKENLTDVPSNRKAKKDQLIDTKQVPPILELNFETGLFQNHEQTSDIIDTEKDCANCDKPGLESDCFVNDLDDHEHAYLPNKLERKSDGNGGFVSKGSNEYESSRHFSCDSPDFVDSLLAGDVVNDSKSVVDNIGANRIEQSDCKMTKTVNDVNSYLKEEDYVHIDLRMNKSDCDDVKDVDVDFYLSRASKSAKPDDVNSIAAKLDSKIGNFHGIGDRNIVISENNVTNVQEVKVKGDSDVIAGDKSGMLSKDRLEHSSSEKVKVGNFSVRDVNFQNVTPSNTLTHSIIDVTKPSKGLDHCSRNVESNIKCADPPPKSVKLRDLQTTSGKQKVKGKAETKGNKPIELKNKISTNSKVKLANEVGKNSGSLKNEKYAGALDKPNGFSLKSLTALNKNSESVQPIEGLDKAGKTTTAPTSKVKGLFKNTKSQTLHNKKSTGSKVKQSTDVYDFNFEDNKDTLQIEDFHKSVLKIRKKSMKPVKEKIKEKLLVKEKLATEPPKPVTDFTHEYFTEPPFEPLPTLTDKHSDGESEVDFVDHLLRGPSENASPINQAEILHTIDVDSQNTRCMDKQRDMNRFLDDCVKTAERTGVLTKTPYEESLHTFGKPPVNSIDSLNALVNNTTQNAGSSQAFGKTFVRDLDHLQGLGKTAVYNFESLRTNDLNHWTSFGKQVHADMLSRLSKPQNSAQQKTQTPVTEVSALDKIAGVDLNRPIQPVGMPSPNQPSKFNASFHALPPRAHESQQTMVKAPVSVSKDIPNAQIPKPIGNHNHSHFSLSLIPLHERREIKFAFGKTRKKKTDTSSNTVSKPVETKVKTKSNKPVTSKSNGNQVLDAEKGRTKPVEPKARQNKGEIPHGNGNKSKTETKEPANQNHRSIQINFENNTMNFVSLPNESKEPNKAVTGLVEVNKAVESVDHYLNQSTSIYKASKSTHNHTSSISGQGKNKDEGFETDFVWNFEPTVYGMFKGLGTGTAEPDIENVSIETGLVTSENVVKMENVKGSLDELIEEKADGPNFNQVQELNTECNVNEKTDHPATCVKIIDLEIPDEVQADHHDWNETLKSFIMKNLDMEVDYVVQTNELEKPEPDLNVETLLEQKIAEQYLHRNIEQFKQKREFSKKVGPITSGSVTTAAQLDELTASRKHPLNDIHVDDHDDLNPDVLLKHEELETHVEKFGIHVSDLDLDIHTPVTEKSFAEKYL